MALRVSRLTNQLPKPRALEPHDRLVERGEKAGAVARRERLGAAGDLAGAAQRIHQVARRQRHADRVFGEGAAVRRDDVGAGFTQRLASGTSAVMTISPRPARSAIRLSASSMPPLTTTPQSQPHRTAIGLLLTTNTFSATPLSACRSAMDIPPASPDRHRRPYKWRWVCPLDNENYAIPTLSRWLWAIFRGDAPPRVDILVCS